VITAAVFNAEQIDGIPALEPERTYDWDPVEQAEKLLRASGAKIEHSQTGGAYYRLATDTIRFPAQDRFETPNAYYATALHELGHNADSRIMPRRMLGTHQSLGNPTRLLGII
jgi:antirestriction protein ArdC